jgi:hypothetical protein
MRRPIASVVTSDPGAGIYVDVQPGEVLTVSARIAPDRMVLVYDEYDVAGHHFRDLGRIRPGEGPVIVTTPTRVAVRAWRGRQINPGPGGGFLNDMHTIEVRDDYQKIGVNNDSPDVVVIELQVSR